MKILLNLLPAEKKSLVRRNEFFRLLVAQEIGIFLLGVLLCFFFFGISFFLSNRLVSIQTEIRNDLSLEDREQVISYEKIFQEVNKKTSEIETLLDRHLSWEKLFRSLEGATPEGVQYTQIFSQENFMLSVSGVASGRDALVDLEQRMNESDCFSSAKVPLSDKLEKENIDFQMDIVIDPVCLLPDFDF